MAGKNDIIARMGLDTSDFDKSLASVVSKTDAAAASTNKLGESIGNTGKQTSKTGYKLGQGAMQVQDFTVQMQNATDKTQAFFTATAQQAPQFLGIFGPTGAIAGGVVAVGASIATAVYHSQKNFDELIVKSEDVARALTIEAKIGGIPELISGIEKAQKHTENLRVEIEGYTKGVWGYFATWGAEFSDAFGGDSAIERIKKAGGAQSKIQLAEMQSRQTLIKTAEAEIEISRLKQKGETDLAEKKERELELAKEIATINSKNIDTYAKQLLISNAVEKSRVKEIDALGAISKKADENLKKADDALKKAQDGIRKNEDLQNRLAIKKRKDAEEEEKRAQQIREKSAREVEAKRKQEQRDSETAQKQAKQAAEEISRAEQRVNDARAAGTDQAIKNLSLKSQMAAKDKQIAEAQKATNSQIKNSLGYFEAMLKLQDLRNEKEALFSQRASNYGTSFAQGRRADREQEKEVKRQQRGERRLREAEARKGQAVRGAASGLGQQQQRGGNIQPRGPAAPIPAADAGKVMQVEVLNVGTLKPK